MKAWMSGIVVGVLMMSPAMARAESGHSRAEGSHAQVSREQTLTGEVVDVFCYLSHGESGLGKSHASCAKKCINGGLPVAIKVGDTLYLAAMADHESANNTLARYAGQQVTVHGKIMQRDGQQFIAVSHVE